MNNRIIKILLIVALVAAPLTVNAAKQKETKGTWKIPVDLHIPKDVITNIIDFAQHLSLSIRLYSKDFNVALKQLAVTDASFARHPEQWGALVRLRQKIKMTEKRYKDIVLFPFDAVKKECEQQIKKATKEMIKKGTCNFEFFDAFYEQTFRNEKVAQTFNKIIEEVIIPELKISKKKRKRHLQYLVNHIFEDADDQRMKDFDAVLYPTDTENHDKEFKIPANPKIIPLQKMLFPVVSRYTKTWFKLPGEANYSIIQKKNVTPDISDHPDFLNYPRKLREKIEMIEIKKQLDLAKKEKKKRKRKPKKIKKMRQTAITNYLLFPHEKSFEILFKEAVLEGLFNFNLLNTLKRENRIETVQEYLNMLKKVIIPNLHSINKHERKYAQHLINYMFSKIDEQRRTEIDTNTQTPEIYSIFTQFFPYISGYVRIYTSERNYKRKRDLTNEDLKKLGLL